MSSCSSSSSPRSPPTVPMSPPTVPIADQSLGRLPARHTERRSPLPCSRWSASSPSQRNMEDEKGAHEAYQSGSSFFISGATMTRARLSPGLSPSSTNICRAYDAARSRDTQMVDSEEYFADEEDADYEEEEEEDDDGNGEEEVEEYFADEDEGVGNVDIVTFSEFLSILWKEYEPMRVDGMVLAAECKRSERKMEDENFAMMLDNASNNAAMMKFLKARLKNKNMLIGGGKLFLQRCAAHVINLVCQSGLYFLEPMTSKICDSVKYIRSSQTRKEKFEQIFEQLGVSCGKSLSLDTPTRWNSTYMMIDTAREYREVFDSLAIQDTNYPFKPSLEDWENADAICSLLKVFYEATNVVSGTNYPTANLYFHEMWKVKLTLDQQHYEENTEFGEVVMYMKRKLKRYWKLSWLNLCIPVIVDPQFKLKYIEFRFRSEFGDDAAAMIAKVDNLFKDLFKEYLQLNANGSGLNPMTQGGDDDMVASDQDPMADWDKHATLRAHSTNQDSSELDSYLKKVPIGRSDQFNILTWWQTNSAEYPTLSRMAADILAAPASMVASESAFSTGKRVLSDFQSRGTLSTAEALVCLQHWIRAIEDEDMETGWSNRQ